MRMAIIDEPTGRVENIILADAGFDPGPGKLLRDAAGAAIGGTWDGAAYQPPPAPPPAPPDPQTELDAAIAAATTLSELKAALLGQSRAGKVAGRST